MLQTINGIDLLFLIAGFIIGYLIRSDGARGLQ